MNSFRDFLFKVTRKIDRHLCTQPTEKIVFLHVPKCGGTAVNSSIRQHFLTSGVSLASPPCQKAAAIHYGLKDPLERDYYYVLKSSELLLLYHMFIGTQYISGHFSFNPEIYHQFKNQYRFITILRDPSRRLISQYFYNRYKGSEHCKTDVDLQSFVESEAGRNLGHEYVKFIGGINKAGDYSSQEAIERAKENLSKFDAVGCLEYLTLFENHFKEKFNIDISVAQRNPNPIKRQDIESQLTDALKEKIEDICAPDREVYNYALEHLIKPPGIHSMHKQGS
jgi:hypothetical protein